jgi:DNA invertase Pin-like site-specific DNA recombinase
VLYLRVSSTGQVKTDFDGDGLSLGSSTSRIDYVIVHKVDRRPRKRPDDSAIVERIRGSGAQLISVSEARAATRAPARSSAAP